MVMLPVKRASWLQRTSRSLTIWVRQSIARVPSLRRPPTPSGISSGRVATAYRAEIDLSGLATSPTVYAAVTARSQSLVTYPVRVFTGYGIGGGGAPLDPEAEPWVGALLRLLQTPDPADLDSLFPAVAGETMLGQVIADLLLTGNGFVAVTSSPSGDVIGLTRMHPRHMTLERRGGSEFWVYGGARGEKRAYPRRTVAHLRLLSWEANGRGVLGTGAGSSLGALVEAERQALQRTADVVSQGGADVVITGKTPASAAFLSNEQNREKVAREASSALGGGADGRRVFVVGGDLDVSDSGLKPADLQAPEMLEAARSAELMALGAVPVSVGADAGSYATAVQQYRAQAAQDEALAYVVETSLLRPLARHFARRAGGRWARRSDEVTAKIDLSSHPGYAYLRTDSMGRMRSLVELGWSPSQAAEAEGLRLPEPAGPPRLVGAVAPTPYSPSPRRPLGDTESSPEAPLPPRDAAQTDWLSRLLTPMAEPACVRAPTSAAVEATRRAEWVAIEQRREKSDYALFEAAQMVLTEDRANFAARVTAILSTAERSVPVLLRAEGDDDEPEASTTDYGPIDYDAITGDPAERAQMYLDGMAPDYADAWESSAEGALDGTGAEGDVPTPSISPAALASLEAAMAQASEFTAQTVVELVRRGVKDGLSVADIAAGLISDDTPNPVFDARRALRIARTETVRADTEGALARYQAAEAVGLTVEREWRSARDSAVRPSHQALDGDTVLMGEEFVTPAGSAVGPGKFGIGGEDINCRCGLIPRVLW